MIFYIYFVGITMSVILHFLGSVYTISWLLRHFGGTTGNLSRKATSSQSVPALTMLKYESMLQIQLIP